MEMIQVLWGGMALFSFFQAFASMNTGVLCMKGGMVVRREESPEFFRLILIAQFGVGFVLLLALTFLPEFIRHTHHG